MAKLRIVHIASEAAPLAKTGGLADAVGAMARAQEQAGHKVAIFLPHYRIIRQLGIVKPEVLIPSLPVHVAPGIRQEVSLLKAELPGSKVTVYLLDHARSYDRDHLYGTPDGDYPDNPDRFVLLCRGALQALKEMKEEVDIVHAHDWQAALTPLYLRRTYAGEPVFAKAGAVYTIHNMAYQGAFPKESIVRVGLGWEMFTAEQLEFFGKVNFMKAGILYADRITTVSPTYANEIVTPEGGFGLDGLLRTRAADLAGVLNGIDEDEWNPEKDKHLAAPYSRRNAAGKAACRDALLAEFGLDPAESGQVLVLGAVARLAEQKGFDLLAEAAPRLMKHPLRIALLGSGERRIQELLEDLARRFPGRIALRAKFDNALAHRVYAGSDAYLMPSRYEPCGLGQMIAMHYGSLPIAHAVGGLVDTIRQVDPRKKQGTGFLFKAATADAFAKAVEDARNAYEDEPLWKKLVTEAMAEDFSWEPTVKRYDQLYADAIRQRAKRK